MALRAAVIFALLFPVLLVLAQEKAPPPRPQPIPSDSADSEAIRQVALDYIEGWYEGDADRMERSLHPELAKRMVETGQNGKSRLDQMGAMSLVQKTRRGSGKGVPRDRQQKEVTILDVFQNAASAKIVASDWVDYLHLVKFNGRWVIINVLWEPKRR